MNGKNFFIVSIITVALVAAVTSLLVISLLKTSILAGPSQEGEVNILGGLGSVVDVIIIDTSVVTGISDIVSFSGVTSGNTYSTQIPTGAYTGPKPFVLRNNGNVKANVDIYSTQTNLFGASGSSLKFWIEPVNNNPPITPLDTPYNVLDNCFVNGPCYTSTTCTSASPCNMPYDVDGPGPPPSVAGDAPIRAINSLEFDNIKDEAFIQIKITVAQDEPAGTKSTKVVITGSQA